MSETFKEYLIKQKKSSTDILAQIGLVVATIILIGVAFMLGGDFIGPILIVGILFGAGFLFSRFSREYEYILTNNELDIDVIYNRSRRKRVMTIDMKKIEIMANIKDERHQSELNKGYKVVNVSDNSKDENTYVIMTQTPAKGACKVIFSPNEAFVNDLFRQAPNKVFKKI
ncbi:DUF6106 family protein [Cellulosilyticum sp. ST5]|uniref:DUF6106 family protein n=1 Tax=unclassified Cellulosilyticum TaxID=2643091 RepID=UPI000F8EF9D8|nr:DUF6106 family protein [Cellulosilyticum sp. WCF-2]QEH70519.1 hypothetical protein EKH84_19780 [Cellulosilyticum sp. WCF-2]